MSANIKPEATDEMIAAAILFVQDTCDIQSENTAANIARGVWDRMMQNAPLEYHRMRKHDLLDC